MKPVTKPQLVPPPEAKHKPLTWPGTWKGAAVYCAMWFAIGLVGFGMTQCTARETEAAQQARAAEARYIAEQNKALYQAMGKRTY
jgi:hypothetical protein